MAFGYSIEKEFSESSYDNELNRILLFMSKVICFSQDIKTESQNKTEIELIYNKGFNKPRMWAQYAENHRGVCLQLNKEKLNEQLNLKIKDKKSQIYRGEVEYNNRFDEFVSALNLDIDGYSEENYRKNIKNHVIKHRKKLFLTKATDWRDEQEYRFIYMSEEDEGFEYVNIKEALEAIYLGIDFPEVYMTSIKELLKETTVKVYKLGLYYEMTQLTEI